MVIRDETRRFKKIERLIHVGDGFYRRSVLVTNFGCGWHTPNGGVTSPLSPPQKKFRWSETFSNSTLGMHPKYEFFCRKGFGKKWLFLLKSFLQINPYLGCISRVLLEGLLLRHKFIKYLQAANDKDTYFDCKSNKRRKLVAPKCFQYNPRYPL